MSWSDLLTPPGDYLAITLGALGLLGLAGLVDRLVRSSWRHVLRIATRLRRGPDLATLRHAIGELGGAAKQ